MLLVFLFSGISIWNYSRSQYANSQLTLVNDFFLPASKTTVELSSHLQAMADDVRRQAFQSNTTSERGTFSMVAREMHPQVLETKFTQLEQQLNEHAHGALLPIVAQMSTQLQSAKNHFSQLKRAEREKDFARHYHAIRSILLSLSRRIDDECRTITAQVHAEGAKTVYSSVFMAVFASIIGLFALWMSHKTLTPLPNLIESVRKIADGDFNQSLKVKKSKNNEVTMLAREYNRMLGALKERDIKIQMQQSELLQSERLAAIGQLSAEIVHEIRNPLNSISLNIDWLTSVIKEDNAEIRMALESLSKEIERLNLITESYLVRARVPCGSETRTGVHELINEILSFSNEEHRQQRIKIVTDLEEQERYVATEKSKFKQAMLNVFRNAREAMPNGGTLTIRSRLVDNTFKLEICDTGYGMNESTKVKTFKPFFTTKTNGTGIGLMLTKSIVEEAQGTIDCESQIGKGTKFVFQFPA